MKHFLLIFFFATNFTLSAQSEDYTGEYEKLIEATKGEIFKWSLNLNSDGTFLYNFYRNLNCDTCLDENFYGKGTWKSESKVVSFYSNKNDIDETHKLKFNNTKARINSKSPRDKSDRIIKTSIRFYSSEEFTIKGLELFKTE